MLENAGATQAVSLADGIVRIVFWSAGEMVLPDGRRIASDQPCLVLASTNSLLIVDPTQKLKTLHFRVDGADREVTLPTGGAAGSANAL